MILQGGKTNRFPRQESRNLCTYLESLVVVLFNSPNQNTDQDRAGKGRSIGSFPKREGITLTRYAPCLPEGSSLLLLNATSPWLHLSHRQNTHPSSPVRHPQHDTHKTRSYRPTGFDLRPARTVHAPHPNRNRRRRALRGRRDPEETAEHVGSHENAN